MSSSWVGEEVVALLQRLQLLEGEGVDGAHEAQLPFEVSGPGGGVGARRQRRAGGDHGVRRLAVELPAHRLLRRLQSQAGLGRLQLHPSGAFPQLAQAPLGRVAAAAEAVEGGHPLGGGPELGVAALAEVGQGGVDLGQPLVEMGTEAVEAGPGGQQSRPAGLRLLAAGGRTRQAGLHLGQAAGQGRAAVVEAGGPHLQLGPERDQALGPGLDARAVGPL